MKVCVVGSGGREHALATVLGRTAEVVVTPGNPGIPGSVATPPEDLEADLFVIGPETPLVDGLADRLRADGRLVFGPGRDGARLEGSKAWMKDLLVAAGVPTATHRTFEATEPALDHLDTLQPPYVVKTDGLAAGKGVVVTDSLADARQAVRDYLSGRAFGDAGRRLVIEEGMTGPEVSVFAVCDGTRAVLFPPAQDFKRVGEGDVGPNTGGMGAFCPVAVPDDFLSLVHDRFIIPTLDELRRRGIDYRGVLYAGLMLTPAGPRLLEYNVRFGDPETQVVVPRITSDLAELLAQAASGELRSTPEWSDGAMVTVILAAEGYPSHPRIGDPISGLERLDDLRDVTVYCAGVGRDTSRDGERNLVTAGGRVLNVCGRGATLDQAREAAYEGVGRVSWTGMTYRRDIARSAVGGR